MDVEQLVGTIGDWSWAGLNLLTIGIALLIMLDVPKADIYEWLSLQRKVKLTSADQTVWGMTTKLSEGGAEIQLRSRVDLARVVTVEIPEEGLTLSGKITCTHRRDKFPRVRVMFEQLSLPQQRRLVEMLFCRPGQWQRHQTPGELRSLWLLLKVFWKPLIL